MLLTGLLIGTILLNFVLLTKGVLKTEVGMGLTAIVAISLAGPTDGLTALQQGFEEFARIAVLFTAIAVPAHMLTRSAALHKLGMIEGEFIGKLAMRLKVDLVLIVVSISLTATYILAALMHNTTSILLSVTLTTLICRSYKIPVVPALSGALVASNLGGFSTRWGDTPNIVEAQTWGLQHAAFFSQILPINLGVMCLLILFVYAFTKWSIRKQKVESISKTRTAYSMVEFRAVKRNTAVDKRLLFLGATGMVAAIFGPLLFPVYEVQISACVIAYCVIGDYSEHRTQTLFTLGMETYATLIAIFVLAQVMAHTHIGIENQLVAILKASHASVPSIIILSYLGTLFTEAASWATAASPIVHSLAGSSRAAWALGAGICAGSSSLITAASAGVLLLRESAANNEDARMTFGKYLFTGLCFSSIMIVYYIIVLSGFLK
jgi:Na+/H+ antiporter NhaD/arsenite permease-like protein